MTTSNTLEKGRNEIQFYTHTKLKRIFQSSWATRLVSPHAFAPHSYANRAQGIQVFVKDQPQHTFRYIACFVYIISAKLYCNWDWDWEWETGKFSARLPSVLLSPNVVDCHRICLHFVYQFFGLVQGWDEVPVRLGAECPAREWPAAVAVTAADTKVHVIGLMDISVLTQFC